MALQPQNDATAPQGAAEDGLYRQIVEGAIDYAILTIDEDGAITSWSEGAVRIFGWARDEAVGRHFSLIFTPEDVAAGVPVHEAIAARTQGRAFDDRWHQRKDGTRFWGSGETMRLAPMDGRAAGAVKIVRDRTEQRLDAAGRRQLAQDLQFLARASEQLSELSDYESTLAKVARLAVPAFADWCTIDVLDAKGNLHRVAVAHADPQREDAAREAMRRMPPDPNSRGGVWEVLRSGRPRLTEHMTDQILERSVPDLQRREALRQERIDSYIAAPLVAHGSAFGVLTFATAGSGRHYNRDDLSLAVDLARRAAVAIENAKLLRELRESDQAKDVFMATLAHELRNPLAPIWNGLSIIKRVPGDTTRVEQVTAMIERQVGQLSRLVDDLLDVSRISRGKIELKKEPTSVVRVISTAVEMSRPYIEAANHKLSLTFPDKPARIHADPARMAQVFSNLLINAAKYTRRGGRIEVVVEAEPAEVAVHVRDNGTGIAPDMLDRVFGMFTQVQQSQDRRQGGLGIGLALVEGLVRLHGGTVEARSAGLEQGSEFIVRLPQLDREVQPSGPQQAVERRVPGAAYGRRILVVDDNVDAAMTVADLLRMSGNEVDVVHDGHSAVEHCHSFRPDVVLLDIGLPDISGYEAARRIRKLEGVRQPTLIALTGWGQQQDKDLAAEAGFDQHWTKPVDPARLLGLSAR